MGGGMKGHGGGGSGGGSYNSRTRSYMLMLLLAFGAAIFGVMLLHKLRERRILNLLTKQKDQQIFSLQLLLQKEREEARGVKRKMEEMKVKIFNLRTQKSKLNSRVSEMQSTISSLKDEQRTVELAFQDVQNEAKMFKDKYGNELMSLSDQNNPDQVVALNEILRQKEAEIEDLKRGLDQSPPVPVKVWSVSTDDPSVAEVIKVKDTLILRNLTDNIDDEETRNSRMENGTNGASKRTGEENSILHSSTKQVIGTLPEFGLLRKIPADTNEELSQQILNDQKGSENGRYTMKGKRIHLKKTRGKRWRTIIINHIDNKGISNSTNYGPVNEDRNTSSNIRAENESTFEQHWMNITRSEDNRRSIFNQGGVEKGEDNRQLKEQDADATIQQHVEADDHDYEGDKNLLGRHKEIADRNDVTMEDVKETGSVTNTSTDIEATSSLEEEKDDQEF